MRTFSSHNPVTAYIFLLLAICFSYTLNAQLPPVISDIPDQEISEGGAFPQINLNEFVTDSDNTDDQLSWNHSASVFTINIENNIATVLTPDTDWYGSEVVTFSVTDPDSNTSSDDALFNVVGVNDAPVIILDIPGLIINEGETFASFNLDGYVEDIDNSDAELTWIPSVNDNLLASIDGAHNATIQTTADGWTGTQSITFTVQDPSGLEDADNADFTINNVNALPVATDDNYTVPEGGNTSTPAPGVLSNDSDADGDVMSATPVSDPIHAAAFNLSADGGVIYTHDGSETTGDDFTYVAGDGIGQSAVANVHITITPVNDLPVITDLPDQTINEGGSFNPIDLNSFVSDAEDNNDLLAWETSGSTQLLVTINESTHVARVRTPRKNWNGSDTITFIVTDTEKGSDSENAVFSVTALAEAPVANDDDYPVDEGATLIIDAPGVLDNDTDGDGDPLTAIKLTDPTHGALTFNSDGSFTYIHDGSETTTDAFTYTAFDGTSSGNTATVTITITPVNEPPVAVDDAFAVAEGGTLIPAAPGLLQNDTDPESTTLSASKVSDPSHGTLTVNSSGSFTYMHDGSETTSDAFTYRASDGPNPSNIATVTITITPVNEPPVAQNDAFTLAEGATLNQGAPGVLLNDSDPETLPLTASKLADPAHGILTLNSNGSFSYVHDGTEATSDFFTYRASDGTNPSNAATVTLTLTPVNDTPALSGLEGTPITYNEGDGAVQLTGSITVADPDNSIASAVITISSNYQNGEDVLTYPGGFGLGSSWSASNGRLTLTGNTTPSDYQAALRTVRYENTSSNPSTLTRTVSFVVNDGSVNSNTVTRNINLSSSNSAPVLNDLSVASVNFTEGEGAVQLSNTITITDIDNTTLESAQISITAGLINTEDVLSFTSANGIGGTYSNGILSLTGTASLVNYRTALRSVTYNNTNNNNPGTANRTIAFTVNDGISTSNTINKTVSVTAVNDPPVLAGIESSALAYNEGDGAVQITNTITVTDVDNLIASGIVLISNYQSGQDVLSFTNNFGVSGSWNAGTGQLSLSGATSAANYQSALRTITYTNTSSNPNTIGRSVRFIVNDGTDNSNQVSRNLTVGNTNNPPVLADPVVAPVVFTEGGPAVQVTNTITVADDDNANMSLATVSITSGFQTGADVLTLTLTGGITGSYNSGTGQISLAGPSLVANYQTVLRSIRYNNTSETPEGAGRVITFIVNDGTSPSNSLLKSVTVTPQNDPPVASDVVITAPNNRIGTVNTGSYTFTDPDGDDEGTSVYQWYRADNSFGNLATAIPGADRITYKAVKADGGKYIGFEVTPVDKNDLAGTPVKSAFRAINAAPVASNVHIYAPVAEAGSTIRGRFTYTDKESDPRGNALYFWYRANSSTPTASSPGTLISNDSTYGLKNTEAGKWVWYRVSPVATSGSTPGDSVWSNIIGPIGTYSANIAGTAIFCQGATMPINLTITGGTAPYTAILHRAGTLQGDTTIMAIASSPRIINVKIPGTYTLVSVTDDGSVEADITAAQPVVLTIHPKAKALLSGNTAICRESGPHVPVTLNFTSGTAPWTVTLRRKETLPFNDTTISNITDDPYQVMAGILGEGPTRYRVFSITDANGCPGDTASGSVWLRYRNSPIATISGTDSICPGQNTSLTITLTSGTPPWSFSYARGGDHVGTIANITTYTYILQVNQPGVYTLESVTDPISTGCGTGQATIIPLTPPTATLSGSATICEHTSGNLNVTLTGTAPWKFSYTRNLVDSTAVQNVLTSPKSVPVMKAGTYRLYEVVDKNACTGTVSGNALITVTPAPQVTMWGLKPAYNHLSTEIDTAFGSPAGGTFSGPGVFGSFLIPQLAPLGTHNIVYAYRASPSSCYGYDTTVVSILESNAIINFPNDRTKYCKNDAPFTVTGVNLEGSVGFFTLSGGRGIVDHFDNTATLYPDSLLPNKYTITYTYFEDGEPLPEPADFDIGIAPAASYEWASECFHEGQSVDFLNKSFSTFGYLTDTSYFWKITTNTGFDSDSSKHISYTFPETGLYTVELKIQNTYGCTDTAIHTLNIRPSITLETAYYEDFETQPISWQSEYKEFPVNTWKLGNPSKHGNPLRGFSGSHSGNSSWYTQITSIPGLSENSWVKSPCFDFTGIDKPMLTMYIWRLFNSNRDGASIQSTTDNGKTWDLVGEIGDGENWFNTSYIRGGPGDKDNGWSNNDGVSNDANWVRARHSLDYLKGRKDVQFRIAYGSDGTPQNNDGIAFDDFSIRERSKMAFIEHFTNSSSGPSMKADSTLDAFTEAYGTNVIDIQYHTSNPAGDPFYESNPMIPTSRQFYYGLSAVPYAVIDGGSESRNQIDYIKSSRPLDKNRIIIQSLKDSKFQVRVEAEMSNNTLTAQVRIKANEEIPLIELSVRVAVIESVIDGVTGENHDTVFRNVVKAMLPDATGITLYRSWDMISDIPIDVSWDIENVYNRDQLRVVAFVQNEATREVYNADMDTVILSTGIDDIPVPGKAGKTEFTLYPNPAQRLATLRFSEEISQEISLEIFNHLGRQVYSVKIPPGTEFVEIPVEEYSDGLYLLRLTTKQKLLGIGKLIILK